MDADRRRRTGQWAVGALVLVAAVVVPLFRQVGVHSWQTLFDEDGPIYSQQAIRFGGLHSLLRGYAGYLQLPPRLLALAAPFVPARDLAWYGALAGTVTCALLGWFVLHMTKGWVRSTPARWALASVVVIMPALGREDTANITNLIWPFLAVTGWALVSRCEGRRDTGWRAAVAFLGAASTPLALAYVPMAVIWMRHRQTRSARVVVAALTAGLVLQIGVAAASTDSAVARQPSTPRSLVETTSGRVFGLLLLGPKWLDALWVSYRPVIVLLAPLLVLGALLLSAQGAERSARWMAALMVGTAVVLFVAAAAGRGTSTLQLFDDRTPVDFALRYSVAPLMLILSSFAVVLTNRVADRVESWTRVALGVLLAQMAVLTVVGFRVSNLQSPGPAWPASVTAVYRAECHGQPPDHLVIVPTGRPDWWPVQLSCRDLAG